MGINHVCKCCGVSYPKTEEHFYRQRSRRLASGVISYGTLDGRPYLTTRCKQCMRKKSAEWRRLYPDETKEACRKWNSDHRERVSGQKRAYYKRNSARIKKRWAEFSKKKKSELRSEMLLAYGSICSCCGESNPAFLTIEHLRGGGKRHMVSCGGYLGMLRDLKQRGWPKDDYTILCYNCNCAKAKRGGICPHEETWAHHIKPFVTVAQ